MNILRPMFVYTSNETPTMAATKDTHADIHPCGGVHVCVCVR